MKPWRLLTTPPARGAWNMAVDKSILEKYLPFPPTLKALLHRLHELPRWSVKPPLESISEKMEEEAFQEIQALDKIKLPANWGQFD